MIILSGWVYHMYLDILVVGPTRLCTTDITLQSNVGREINLIFHDSLNLQVIDPLGQPHTADSDHYIDVVRTCIPTFQNQALQNRSCCVGWPRGSLDVYTLSCHDYLYRRKYLKNYAYSIFMNVFFSKYSFYSFISYTKFIKVAFLTSYIILSNFLLFLYWKTPEQIYLILLHS